MKPFDHDYKTFIPDDEIFKHLQTKPDKQQIRDIIQKSLDKHRLDPAETAALLNAEDPELLEEIFEGARTLKKRIYGNRIVFFAPLYIGNKCINNCTYCGFRASNTQEVRRTLTMKELEDEVRALERHGHKRLILVYGEHPDYGPQFIYDTVRCVYEVKEGKGEIRRVNINAAPLDVEGFKKVKSAGIGTYQIFQETYHWDTYKKLHGSGPKSDFLWRLHSFDRAQEAGIDDVGMGALIGLYNWKFEVMAMLYHTIHLEERFHVGPHTISFPRIEPAHNTEFSLRPPYAPTDEEFKRLVAIIRLSVPYTGMILTAREPVAIRNEVLKFGVSQIDAGSNIGIGGYAAEDGEGFKRSQFTLGDQRSLDEVIGELGKEHFLPSFCTACYRMGRTGEHFMEFAIPGFVKRFCTPNAILTFKEYLDDYAGEETRQIGEQVIAEELAKIPDGDEKNELLSRLEKVHAGQRDLHY